MRSFEFVAPGSLDEALDAVARHAPHVRLLAGGTDLLVELKHAANGPQFVVDLGRVRGLRGIEVTSAGLRIGALVTHSEIVRSLLIAEHAPAMVAAAATIGAVQTRNMGTIGGNLVTCVPSLDSGPVLVALDALVTVVGAAGKRQMPITEFFVGPRKTALAPDEILVDVLIPAVMLGRSASFRKFGLRKGQALALVSAAASVAVEGGLIVETRIALGAVSPTVVRALRAEAMVTGMKVGDTAGLREAAQVAVTEARPIDDFRASAAYRRELIAVGTFRVLEEALAKATAV
ncbi:MAG TPA: xanthine dehydrogenase family protein subunit M [Acidimicrobiia bacterium]|nr:xanthine dehydrogenase family protein subunit M [Acidimicrobiia bacterium]